MRNNIILISREVTAFLISGLVLVFCMAMVYIDVNWMNDALHETSFTEITQELMLLLIATFYFLSAWQPITTQRADPGRRFLQLHADS